MLQNTVRIIQQQDRCQRRCWEPHYDESHFISCHSRCLTNNYICPGSVVHELIITYHQSSERSCQRQIISVYHAALACSSKSKQTAKRNGEANMRRLLYFTVCGLKRWRSVSRTGDTLKNRTISTGCQKETATLMWLQVQHSDKGTHSSSVSSSAGWLAVQIHSFLLCGGQ